MDPSSPYSFPWDNSMLLWQRTAFHFQPTKNWMNDPCGLTYYKGWYHLFYQYNPEAAVWGNMSWGHAVSRDLIRWLHLPLAMVPDRWYDAAGVFTGSATTLPDGRIAMLYTGHTKSSQMQNLAFPADPDDRLLLSWVKSESNPLIVPPPGIAPADFRDPSTAWYVAGDATWRIVVGAMDNAHRGRGGNGKALVFRTADLVSYELPPKTLREVAGTGMWECVDFYPVSTSSAAGLDTSAAAGPGVKHVLKTSLFDEQKDYYAIGTYEAGSDAWAPDEPEKDAGIGLRYDYGRFFASKTFYDPVKKRRVLLGWVAESDSRQTDLLKGWASVMSIPRTVLFDQRTGSSLLQWPVEEVESLRSTSFEFSDITVGAVSVVPLDVGDASQLDIVVEFEVDKAALAAADTVCDWRESGGAAERGPFGPFGLLVLADEELSEQTAAYFYIGRSADGSISTRFCQDELRSSLANDVVKSVHGSSVPVMEDETLSLRVLVDHSIVESFAQGGRTCITSRAYPTKAINGAARLFLFNNATAVDVTAKSLKVWRMDSASIRPYSEEDFA